MARSRSLATLALIVATVLSSATVTLQGALAGEPGKLVIGYLASWKAAADKTLVPSLPARHLTHIYLAFGNVSETGVAKLDDPCSLAGRCRHGATPKAPGGVFAQLARLKAANPGLRILISIGGWTNSKYFSKVAATAAGRRRFADSIIRVFFRPFPRLFDGVDIDWEYPVSGGAEGNLRSPLDRENFPKLMAEVRRQLDQFSATNGQRYDLSIAVSADRDELGHLALAKLLQSVDWITVMAYDYYAGADVTGFNAPLFGTKDDPISGADVDSSIRRFIKAGVPPKRLVLGLPFYGRAYGEVPNKALGLFQKANPAGAPSWGGTDGIGFKELIARRPEQHGFRRSWHATSMVPWLYNARTKTWISYDDARSIARKAAYARSMKLGGVAIWELSGDDGTLFRAILAGLGSAVPNGDPQ